MTPPPSILPKMSPALRAKMLPRVQAQPNGCLLWTGGRNGDGYGVLTINDRKMLVHRLSWVAEHGETIGPDIVIRHTCDTRTCLNPDHLLKGTHAENVADRVARGRSATETRNGRAKLNADQARAIFLDDRSAPTISTEYGIDPAAVRHIKNRKNWRSATKGLARPGEAA